MAGTSAAAASIPVELQIEGIRQGLAKFKDDQKEINNGIVEDKRMAVADSRDLHLQVKAIE